MATRRLVMSTLLAIAAVVVYALLVSPWRDSNVVKLIQGKRCLVTGASLGIGKEIARELVRDAASHVTIIARSEDKLNTLRDELLSAAKEQNGSDIPEIHVISADLSSRETSEKVIQSAVEEMGGIDFLVLNHITNSRYGLWTEQPRHDFVSEMFDVNTLSYIWIANAALESLQASGGQIIVVSSLAGWVGVPFTAVYSATKHALRGFFNALRTELEMYRPGNKVGITLCNIGAVDTEGSRPIQSKINVDWVEPHGVAKAIVAGGALRHREVYFPLSIYSSIILHFFSPKLMEYILNSVMT